jgi:hypothetical protein
MLYFDNFNCAYWASIQWYGIWIFVAAQQWTKFLFQWKYNNRFKSNMEVWKGFILKQLCKEIELQSTSKIAMFVYDSQRIPAAYQLLLTMNSRLVMPWRWWFCPNFDNISTRHSVSSKLSTTLARAYMTLVQWAWNFRLLGRSFRGTSLNASKCLWWLGFDSKNLHNYY